MAITTVDGAIAGMQPPVEFAKNVTGTLVAGRPHSLFYLAGIPGAATAPSPGVGGAALTTYAGQLPWANPSSGNSYLARLQAQATIGGSLLLCDRLWHNSGLSVTSNTSQNVNSVAWPARDRNGSTNGDGVFVGLEVSSGLGAGTPTLTLGYTNSAGVDTRSGTNIQATVASSIAGTFYQFGLAAGDVGVRSIQTYTQSATMTTGAHHLVAYRILARLELTSANVPNALDLLTGGFPRLFDNTVPFLLFIPSTTTTSNITGHAIWSQG
ncbi:MAG: hypothetical protein E6Q97_02310 [Desulfurellales bacterium]|nr:MAG: hypothetical protein E6Q97_02310 [Desulfurellales bacterium]